MLPKQPNSINTRASQPIITAKRFSGLYGSAKAWLVSQHSRESAQLCVICKDKNSADNLKIDLEFFCPPNSVLEFPAWDILPFEPLSPQIDISAQRLWVTKQITSRSKFILVTSLPAIAQKAILPSWIDSITASLRAGEICDRDDLLLKLIDCGYRHVSLAEEIGDLAIRGGTVDLVPFHTTHPVRIEFAANKVRSIRLFDSDSQRSLSELDSLTILPLRESIASVLSKDKERATLLLERLKLRAEKLEVPPSELDLILEAIKNQSDLPGIEQFNAFLPEQLSSLLDFLPSTTKLFVDDQLELDIALDAHADLVSERCQRFERESRLISEAQQSYLTPEQIRSAIFKREPTYLDRLDLFGGSEYGTVQKIASASNAELATKLHSRVGSGKALGPLKQVIEKWRTSGLAVGLVVGSVARAQRLSTLLLNCGLLAEIKEDEPHLWLERPEKSPLVILIGQLSAGVQLPEYGLALVSENEIFSERSHRKKSGASRSVKRFLSALSQLTEGDFVVHLDYGIGQYLGLKHQEIEGRGHDFILLEYAENSKLYLPVENIGKIQKFVSEEGKKPRLDKLGSTRWARAKAKVKAAVITLAGDLIKLYATRSTVQGWRFEPSGAEDDRFADGFGFDETPDQLAAIKATLSDMASARPMDRLICGDAGFGKTEVALRAAFKCSQHARQIAVLVPTTILVEQHRQVFSERFAGYPIKVAAMSRFYSSEQNRQTLAALNSGEVDIVIGTHRLLQSDVRFKDLGLVIIDEEHRFGVKHKETLKQLKKNVDVLTLTATPIPRTLHMALLGIRDISIISTPPHDRRVIRTYVATHDDTIIRDAILKELQRGGQCFYLHNKIMNIATVTDQLAKLAPEARFSFGHGQMKEHQLEKIMLSFIKRETDVLVSTTIIESGLDIPNANTIIVNRADTFGLAQLYQLRGRVGRSNRQAYCYLLIPEPQRLSADARKRLKVLQNLDDLGLGFNLATRDLEIRGAGNLLGKDQSGQVQSVGLELYNRILKEAIAELRGEEVQLRELVDPELKIGVNAFIPERYIPDVSERLILYQRLASLEDSLAADQLRDEMRDRFGELLNEVENLLELMRYRALLRNYGVSKAELTPDKLLLSFAAQAKVNPDRVREVIKLYPDRYRLAGNSSLVIKGDYRELKDPSKLYRPTEELLGRIAN